MSAYMPTTNAHLEKNKTLIFKFPVVQRNFKTNKWTIEENKVQYNTMILNDSGCENRKIYNAEFLRSSMSLIKIREQTLTEHRHIN